MPTLIMVNIWKEFSFVMIMMIAGLQTVPEGLLRAARIDGAGTWNQFWHVTVPHLRRVILITTLLLFVTNLNSFTLVWLMTGGGPANASHCGSPRSTTLPSASCSTAWPRPTP